MKPPIPPQNLEAEQSVLGSLLIRHECYADVVSPECGLTVEDFYDGRHRAIFGAMRAIVQRGDRLDLLTVQDEITKRDLMSEVGGAEYLLALIDSVPTTSHATYYAAIVHERAVRRTIIANCQTVTGLAYDPERELTEVRERFTAAALALSEGRPETEWHSYEDIIGGEVLPRLEQAYQTGSDITGIPSGIRDLDSLTCGWNAPDLIIVAGRTSQGKTALAMQCAEHAARLGHPVGVFSIEMAATQLGLRAVQAAADISGYHLRHPRSLGDDGWGRLVDGASDVSQLPIYVNHYGSLRWDQIIPAAERLRAKHGVELLVLDFLQLVIGPRGENRNREVGIATHQMKQCAKRLNVPFIALSQLSRRADQEKRPPMLSDLRDCLPGDALVFNCHTGERVPIRDIAEDGLRFHVLGLNETTLRLKPAKIRKAWSVGEKPMLRIETETGRTLVCSTNHKLYHETGSWREASRLRVGDYIGNPRWLGHGCDLWQLHNPTVGKAELLGLIVGDGSTRAGCADLTVGNQGDADYVSDLCEKEFGFRPSCHESSRTSALRMLFCVRGGVNGGNPMTRWLRAQGMWGVGGADKHTPEAIFTASQSAIAGYLRGLFHADGSLPSADLSKRTAKLSTISERLAREVQHLLLRLGILASVHRHQHSGAGYKSSTPYIWLVAINSREQVQRFIDRVGFLGDKQRRAVGFATAWREDLTDVGNRDRLPDVTDGYIREIKAANNLTWKTLGYRLQGKRMSRKRAAIVAEQFGHESLMRLATSDLTWDRVARVDWQGMVDAYDLTIGDGVSSFCVDGFLTHNSGEVEQYADVVIFLQRDPELPEGELYVAKNRQLSCGKVPVRWSGRTMRFSEVTERSE